ncbi:hypothetical protein GOBAR_AA20369 [Gossypium barbadense]|uniref:Uncharacterized protein n=1 Tax=Gossypium barbadense TaxID=3634 RepID=A0A2P5XAF5_GOSBA|nr:hypothetical protein GOBAR_AA20369 [Gossypium barbadense]
MLLIDPDAARAIEFPKYPNILPPHRLAVDSEPEELFVGQKFETKKECVFSIKRYSMNVLVTTKSSCLNRHCILGSVGGRRKAAIGEYKLHLSKSRRCERYKNLLGLTHALQYV